MGLSSTVVQLLMAGLCRGELVGGGRCAAVVRSAGFVVDGDGEIGEDKQAAGERGERRGTVLVSVRRVAELGRKESGQPNGWSGWFV